MRSSDVHRQREEVDVAQAARDRCAKDHRVALADDDGTGGLALAILPVSKEISLPAISTETV